MPSLWIVGHIIHVAALSDPGCRFTCAVALEGVIFCKVPAAERSSRRECPVSAEVGASLMHWNSIPHIYVLTLCSRERGLKGVQNARLPLLPTNAFESCVDPHSRQRSLPRCPLCRNAPAHHSRALVSFPGMLTDLLQSASARITFETVS